MIDNMRFTETKGHHRHLFRTDREGRNHPLHVSTCCKQAKIRPSTSYTEQRAEHPLHFAESEAHQLFSERLSQKKYTLAEMLLFLVA